MTNKEPKIELSDKCIESMGKIVTGFSDHLDKELADAIVTLGVGQHRKFGGVPIRYRFVASDENMYASEFVRDWRVVGALMEKVNGGSWVSLRPVSDKYSICIGAGQDKPTMGMGESLPRAINEAAVAALSVDKT